MLEEWRKLKSYVVGISTGEAAEKLGLIPIGEETGSAEKLAEYIVSGSFTFVHHVPQQGVDLVGQSQLCDGKMT